MDISTALQEVGFPENTDDLKFDLFLTKLYSETDEIHIGITSTPLLNDEDLMEFVQFIDSETFRCMEPGTRYGLHFDVNSLTKFSVDDEAVEKTNVHQRLWKIYRNSVMAAVYENIETVIEAIGCEENIITIVNKASCNILRQAVLFDRLKDVRPLRATISTCRCHAADTQDTVHLMLRIGHGNVFSSIVATTVERCINGYLDDRERSYMRTVSTELTTAATSLYEAAEA